MGDKLRTISIAGVVLALAGSTFGCIPALVGTSATVGVSAAQERSVGHAVDDTTIHAEVSSNLLQVSEKLFINVGVEVVEGRVLLTGAVPKPEDRVEAARLTWKVNGVKEVLNEIEVNDKSGLVDFAKDTWITTQMRTKMLTDSKISDINYSVETVNAVIYLMGIAQNQAELDRVTTHARNISGVRKVVSHVILKDDPRRKS